jgi:hypothetical protein
MKRHNQITQNNNEINCEINDQQIEISSKFYCLNIIDVDNKIVVTFL